MKFGLPPWLKRAKDTARALVKFTPPTAVDLTSVEEANGWTAETLAAYQAERHAAAMVVVGTVLQELDPATRQLLLSRLRPAEGGGIGSLTSEEVITILERVDWRRWRPQILDLFLHQSRILELVPAPYRGWVPLVHDFLLIILDGLSEERLVERVVQQARLPADASRGERILAFLARTPTLQKIGQMIARNPEVRSGILRPVTYVASLL